MQKKNKLVNFIKTWWFPVICVIITGLDIDWNYNGIIDALCLSTIVFSIACIPVILVKLNR